MIDRISTTPPPLRITLTVSTEAQLRELDAAWREIIAGGLPRIQMLEHDEATVLLRAQAGLARITTAICTHPGTGQSGRLVRFLAGLYHGPRYPFDLTDLRALDSTLADACLDYLNYDRLGRREVHHHLAGGACELNHWIVRHRIRARRT